MYLEFNDEQLKLRETVRASLARECPPHLVRSVADGGPGADALATAVAWLGWPALTIDVDLGGLGRSLVELAIVLEGMGRAAAPGAYLPTMTQFVPAVREVGTPAQAHRFLSAVAAGEVTGTLALHEGGRWDPDTVVATAQRDGDGWLLRGTKHHVLGAPDVDEVVVAARRDTGPLGLFVVPAAELSFTRTASLDATRSLARVDLDGVWVPDARLLGGPDADVDGGKAIGRVVTEAVVGLALDALGACDALIDASLEVALQGGVAGQATEHALADMVVAADLARAATYQATAAVAAGDASASQAASVAKAAVGECQRLVARTAIEVCGGTTGPGGLPLDLWVGRAEADALLFGSAADHRRIVADHLLVAQRARHAQLSHALLG